MSRQIWSLILSEARARVGAGEREASELVFGITSRSSTQAAICSCRRAGVAPGSAALHRHPQSADRTCLDMPTEDLGGTVEQVVEAAVTAVRENRDGGRSSAG
jgi:hypothetical protein